MLFLKAAEAVVDLLPGGTKADADVYGEIMTIERDIIRLGAPPILAACVVALLVGPPPDDGPTPAPVPVPHATVQGELVGAGR